MYQQMITIILIGPSLTGVGGVSTHVNQLFYSVLAEEFNFVYFQVGSEGRKESLVQKLARFVLSPVELFWLLIKSKAKIVHLNTTIRPKSYWRDVIYLFIARIMGKKIIYQVHGGVLPQDFYKNSIVLSYFFKLVLRTADVVLLLAQSELIAYRNFAPELCLKVIPNAIEVGADPQWKKSPPTHYRPLKLVFIGRLVKTKGIFEIIEALSILRNQGRNIQLIIAGSGTDELMLSAYVKSMGLNDYISFLGAIFNEEKTRVWEEADLFVFPTHQEGLPYTLLESMAARTPSLVCPVGGIPDVIEDGVHGLFIPLRNAQVLADNIERLDNDRALICGMGEACRQRVLEHYTIDRMIGDFRRTYLNTLKNEN